MKIKKNIYYFLIFIFSIFIGSYLWPYIKIPLNNFEIKGNYSINNYNAPTMYISGGKLSGAPGWQEGYAKPDVVKYAHGGAKLTAIDSQTNRIVWEGLAQGDLYDPNIMYDDLHPSIHKMMKRFPIKIPRK